MNLETFRDRLADLEAMGRAYDIAEAVLERRCELEAARLVAIGCEPAIDRINFLVTKRVVRGNAPEYAELRALQKRIDAIADDLQDATGTGGLRRALTAVMLNYPATYAIELLEETP